MPAIAQSRDITPGEIRAIDLQGAAIGVANVDTKFYAFTAACSHCGASLSQGRLAGMTITCSCGSQFDLASGHASAGPATKRIRTYRVQLKGEELHI